MLRSRMFHKGAARPTRGDCEGGFQASSPAADVCCGAAVASGVSLLEPVDLKNTAGQHRHSATKHTGGGGFSC